MIKSVVFDFDGVIIDSNKLKYDAFFRIFSPEYSLIIQRVLESHREKSRFEILTLILDEKASVDGITPKMTVSEKADDYAGYINRHLSQDLLIAGSLSSLRVLSKRYPLFLNSTTPTDHLDKIIDQLKLRSYFTGIYGSPGNKVENFRQIESTYSIRGEEMIFIGDSQSDLDAARVIGTRFIGVANCFNEFSINEEFLVINDLTSLPDIVNEMIKTNSLGKLI